MAHMQVRTVNEIETDADFLEGLQNNRRVLNALAAHFGTLASEIGAALSVYDRAAGRKRKGRTTRRIAVAAGLMVLAGRALRTADRSFRVDYKPEIDAARGRARRQPRSSRMRFGD